MREPHHTDSQFIRHAPCPSCKSKDNLAVYSDHCFCFGCGYRQNEEGAATKSKQTAMTNLLDVEYQTLTKRSLKEDTCKKWGYGVSNYNGHPVQVANYRTLDNKLIGQKVRLQGKKFILLGDTRKITLTLYGAHLWPNGGKMMVVTEGEIDALSVNQAQGLKWPCCSISGGAQSAAKCVAANLEYLESFETVVFAFDMDDPGQAAAIACAELLPPGKAKIASLPRKDANEMLVEGLGSEILTAMFSAKAHRPDGLVYGDDPDLWEKIRTRENMSSIPYPWEGLNAKLHGIRQSEMVVITSGTGIGKSSVCRELAHHIMKMKPDEKVGYIALEESCVRSSLGIIGVEINRPVHLDHIFNETDEGLLKEGYDNTLGTGRVVFYDHFGSMENDRLLGKIRQMVKGCGVTTIFLDHLSIVCSAIEGGDERRRIDSVCTKLRQIVEEMRISLFLVSHLRRGEGKALEEGGKTSINLLRGSAAIAQLADIVIGLERNQQGENANLTTVRCLKNRYSGETGICTWLEYQADTGRLVETTLVTPEPGESNEF